MPSLQAWCGGCSCSLVIRTVPRRDNRGESRLLRPSLSPRVGNAGQDKAGMASNRTAAIMIRSRLVDRQLAIPLGRSSRDRRTMYPFVLFYRRYSVGIRKSNTQLHLPFVSRDTSNNARKRHHSKMAVGRGAKCHRDIGKFDGVDTRVGICTATRDDNGQI